MAEEGEEKNRCKGERVKENLGDLMIGDYLMSNTLKTVKALEAKMNKCTVELFDACKWSIPPLMVACVLGYKDIVKFLLEKGANPNEKCTEERNTPLHYACMLREYFEESDSQAEWHFVYEEDTVTKKEEIIKLLFDHGAVLERNSLGFLPIHSAALFAMEKIVDYFITREPVTDADRLLAMEVLEVSQAVMIVESNKAYFTFLAALHIHRDIACEVSPFPSELGQHFKCNECATFDELYRLKYDNSAMFIHGLLVGERVLPEKLKQKCLWPNMLWPHYDMEKYLCACQYGLKLEMNSRLAVGTVLEGITDLISSNYHNDIQEKLLIQIASCLEKYNETLKIDSDRIADQSYQFSNTLADILRELVWWCIYCRKDFEILFPATVGVVKVYSEQTSAYENTYSVARKFLEIAIDQYDPINHLSRREMRNVIVTWNHILPVLLKYEHNAHTKDASSETMLHMAMEVLEREEDFDVISAITHTLVRHGCPIEAKNSAGKTAKDIALTAAQDFEIDHPEFDEILALLSEPSEVLSLQELSARCVLRSRIPYSLGTVPVTVYDFLNGEDFMQTEMIMD